MLAALLGLQAVLAVRDCRVDFHSHHEGCHNHHGGTTTATSGKLKASTTSWAILCYNGRFKFSNTINQGQSAACSAPENAQPAAIMMFSLRLNPPATHSRYHSAMITMTRVASFSKLCPLGTHRGVLQLQQRLVELPAACRARSGLPPAKHLGPTAANYCYHFLVFASRAMKLCALPSA
jgi:hypothetical protein